MGVRASPGAPIISKTLADYLEACCFLILCQGIVQGNAQRPAPQTARARCRAGSRAHPPLPPIRVKVVCMASRRRPRNTSRRRRVSGAIADKQTRNGGDFAYANGEPVRPAPGSGSGRTGARLYSAPSSPPRLSFQTTGRSRRRSTNSARAQTLRFFGASPLKRRRLRPAQSGRPFRNCATPPTGCASWRRRLTVSR